MSRALHLCRTVSAAALFGLFACAQPAGKPVSRDFDMTLFFADPRHVDGGRLDDEVVKLALPLLHDECRGMAFVPKLQLLRLDRRGAQVVVVEPKTERDWISRVQDFYGQRNVVRVSRDIETAVRRYGPPVDLSAPVGDEPVLPAAERIVGTMGSARLFVLDNRGGHWPSAFGAVPLAVAKTVDDLMAKVAAALCSAERGHEEQLPSIAVLLDAPRAPETGAPADQRPATPVVEAVAEQPSSANHAPPSPPAAAPSEATASGSRHADDVLHDIEGRLSQPNVERRQIDELLKAAQTEFPHDYRFPYVRGRVAVYGRAEHHEAFSQLFHAAEVAIINDDAHAMLDDLARDGRDGGALGRLAHGHGDWQRLLAALRSGDVSLARQ